MLKKIIFECEKCGNDIMVNATEKVQDIVCDNCKQVYKFDNTVAKVDKEEIEKIRTKKLDENVTKIINEQARENKEEYINKKNESIKKISNGEFKAGLKVFVDSLIEECENMRNDESIVAKLRKNMPQGAKNIEKDLKSGKLPIEDLGDAIISTFLYQARTTGNYNVAEICTDSLMNLAYMYGMRILNVDRKVFIKLMDDLIDRLIEMCEDKQLSELEEITKIIDDLKK